LIKILSGDYEAAAAPEAGGALISLSRNGMALCRSGRSLAAVKQDPREAACFPCVPWFGRLYGDLEFDGRRWTLASTLPACDPDHALHGHGWVGNWQIASQTDHSIDCSFSYTPRKGGFPFSFNAELGYALSEDGLAARLTLINSGDADMPAGLGLHPYFKRTENTRILFNTASCWTPPSGGEGGQKSAIPGLMDFSAGKAFPNQTVDHSFIGFGGKAVIENNGATITLTSDAPIIHLFAPYGDDFFCLEPISHLPGRFGEAVLHPGQSMSLQMQIAAA